MAKEEKEEKGIEVVEGRGFGAERNAEGEEAEELMGTSEMPGEGEEGCKCSIRRMKEGESEHFSLTLSHSLTLSLTVTAASPKFHPCLTRCSSLSPSFSPGDAARKRGNGVDALSAYARVRRRG